MSEGDFLARWSRLKREAARKEQEIPAAEPAPPASPPPEAAEPDPPPPLPSLDEITATTDISVFMHPAVPAPLRHAALRRMWSLDPAIRDFVSEAVDYAHDYNAPDSIPGFGRLGVVDDVARMVADLVTPRADPEQRPGPVPEAERADPAGEGRDTGSQASVVPASVADATARPEAPPPSVRPAADGPSGNEAESRRPEPPAGVQSAPDEARTGRQTPPRPRRHGGALPV